MTHMNDAAVLTFDQFTAVYLPLLRAYLLDAGIGWNALRQLSRLAEAYPAYTARAEAELR